MCINMHYLYNSRNETVVSREKIPAAESEDFPPESLSLYVMTMLISLGFLHLTLVDILDILLVGTIIYFAFRWIKGSSAMNIFIAIILLVLIRVISTSLGMKMLSSIMGTVIDVGAIALIIIFQPEIRRFLNNFGRSAGSTIENRELLLQKILPRKKADTLENASIKEIAQACKEMSDEKTGALIIIRKGNSLESTIETGDIVDSRISKRLIMNIFFKNSPLHDGAMVIGDGRIIAARCTLPITDRSDIPAHYGMRHKAAIGISEQCDAQVLVVSEQTGQISFVQGGRITKIDNINDLKRLLGGTAE